jgi:uncharacterized phage protein gp47/JayE
VYEEKIYENIKQGILSGITIPVDKREGSVVNDMISPVSVEIAKAYTEFEKMLSVMFLGSGQSYYIDKRVNEYGVYRKDGTKATGAVTFTGINNTSIPKGSLVQTQGGLLFQTINDATVINLTASVNIEALEIGSVYNVIANSITKIPVAIPGVTAVVNNSNLTGGTNIEGDEALVKRFLDQLQTPTTSGNPAHYRQWALSVNGAGNAKVIPIWNGPGTVKVLVIDSNNTPANASLITNVADYIETQRPIGATVTVVAPSSKSIAVSAALMLSTDVTLTDVRNAFDIALDEYLKSLAFTGNPVSYAKIGGILLSIKGITDYTNLTVNSGTVNVSISDTEIPIKGTVTLS